jgi:predicted aspartyl protease
LGGELSYEVEMTVRLARPQAFAQILFRAALAAAFLAAGAQFAFAASCSIVKHQPPTDADKALLAADYVKAASLYQAGLAQHPGDEQLTAGLVHALLRQQKVKEAADAVTASLAVSPKSAPLITLRGEVELRQGEPWAASKSAAEANKIDPCNPRTLLLFVEIANMNSLYATARNVLTNAHKLDPEDPSIRLIWIGTLPLKQRIPELEAYLNAPTGHDADSLRQLRTYLDRLKKLAAETHKSCHIVSQETSAEVPFTKIMYDATHMRAFGLEVKLNNTTARLQIDTGADGLVLSRSVAQHAGLRIFSREEIGGVGDKGEQSSYTAYVDSIRIGNLEFQDCAVEVIDSHHGMVDEADGLIGMDVFSRFLVTLDFPMHKLLLAPLPARPGDTSAGPSLNTDDLDTGDSDSAAEPATQDSQAPAADKKSEAAATGSPAAAAPTQPTPKPAPHGPFDRYIAPEMKDYTPVYRVGHNLILPASLNEDKVKLFIMDTGASTTTISPEAAKLVTRVHRDEEMEVHGISGNVDKVYSADNITFRFAHVVQQEQDVVSIDSSNISKSVGMEISGLIGATTLGKLTIHIDYRDGLVKFDYDPNRGYKF